MLHDTHISWGGFEVVAGSSGLGISRHITSGGFEVVVSAGDFGGAFLGVLLGLNSKLLVAK